MVPLDASNKLSKKKYRPYGAQSVYHLWDRKGLIRKGPATAPPKRTLVRLPTMGTPDDPPGVIQEPTAESKYQHPDILGPPGYVSAMLTNGKKRVGRLELAGGTVEGQPFDSEISWRSSQAFCCLGWGFLEHNGFYLLCTAVLLYMVWQQLRPHLEAWYASRTALPPVHVDAEEVMRARERQQQRHAALVAEHKQVCLEKEAYEMSPLKFFSLSPSPSLPVSLLVYLSPPPPAPISCFVSTIVPIMFVFNATFLFISQFEKEVRKAVALDQPKPNPKRRSPPPSWRGPDRNTGLNPLLGSSAGPSYRPARRRPMGGSS